METAKAIVDFLLGLGPSVMLPIIIFILGLVLRAPAGRAFRAALMIGVGFVGIGLVIGLLVNNLGPAAQAMVERFGVRLEVIDVGWPAAAAIAFGSRIATLIIPVAILVNIVMLVLRLTKTVNVDIWNFWHFAFTGALVHAATGSFTWGLVAAAINAAIALFLADWTAPAIQEFYALPGISLPHGFSAAYVPIAIPVNRVINLIPGLRDLKADPDTIRERFGVFGEPILVGLVLGIVIGALGYGGVGATREWITKILVLGMAMAGVMVLLPRMVALLMEGLIPISEAAREFMVKRFAGREFYIGLDSAIAIGHPAAISAALVLVPITLLLAVVLPGNRVLPFGDLATIPFLVAMFAPITRGNVIRSVIVGTIAIGAGLYIATSMSGLHTTIAQASGFEFPAGATTIASICDGANPLTWFLLTLFSIPILGLIVTLVILGLAIFFFKRNPRAWMIWAGASEEKATESAAAEKGIAPARASER